MSVNNYSFRVCGVSCSLFAVLLFIYIADQCAGLDAQCLIYDSVNMSTRYCCVVGCTNGGYGLKKWKTGFCSIHQWNFGSGRCICEPPFSLIPFPTEAKDKHARSIWIKNVNRSSLNNNWQPNKDSRVCSVHFKDGQPTKENPYPTLFMGHTEKVVEGRPPPKERSTSVSSAKKRKSSDVDNPCTETYDDIYTPNSFNVQIPDHDYLEYCNTCTYKQTEISSLKQQVKSLKQELATCQKQLQILNVKAKGHNSKMTDLLSNDKKVKFYTGIPSKAAFDAVYNQISPYLKNVRYWRGPTYHCTTIRHKKFLKARSTRKLTAKEEMLLVCMKLRLGLLDEDLADRFKISTSYVSRIFTTWLLILKKFLGLLVFNAQKEVVRANLPPSFRNAKYSSVRHIIDCSEIFIEKPNNLKVQNQCWSDYKHHHTAKFLLSINPSGMINFVSTCWGGRASDKHITLNSGFMEILEPYDAVMADKGFSNLLPDFTLLHTQLLTPPGRHGAAQIPAADVLKTKQIANRRIYVEQAIRRLKYFRILKFEVPITLCQHLDDILRVICGICNLYPPLPVYDKK